MAFGVMPCRSFTPTPASGGRRWPPPQLRVLPWRMKLGVGCRRSSPNKLAAAPIRAFASYPSFYPSRRGDGEGEDDGSELSLAIWCGFASETGLWRWIWRAYSCSFSSTFSTTSCSGATAPSGGLRLRKLAAGLDCYVADLSGRRAANRSSGDSMRRLLTFLPAVMPKGRQFGLGLASVSSLSGIRGRWSDGETPIPSGDVPGDGVLGPRSKPRRRRTTLRFPARARGLFCEVPELSCNFLFFEGPCTSCTFLQNYQ